MKLVRSGISVLQVPHDYLSCSKQHYYYYFLTIIFVIIIVIVTAITVAFMHNK